MKHYALLSVNDTRDIRHFAEVINALGWSVLGTRKPCEILVKEKIDVTSIQEFTGVKDDFGFPPTLHPKIEHALTSDQSDVRIELVYNITYGSEEGNDVGGHALLALAAKGNRLPVSSHEHMKDLMDILEKDKEITDEKRQELITRTNWEIASHYAQLLSDSGEYAAMSMKRGRKLLIGENPYQVPSHLMARNSDDPLALHQFHQLSGNIPCFTNMADADCIVDTLCKLDAAYKKNLGRVPYIVIAAKHGNACGIGINWESPAESIRTALWGNPMAIWGGEVAVNFPLEKAHASLLYSSKHRGEKLGSDKWMLDLVLAPDMDKETREILGQRRNTKLLVNQNLATPSLDDDVWVYRFVRGGFLRQPPASYVLDFGKVRWFGKKFSERELDSLIIAWACAFTANHGGNEIAITRGGGLLGAGGGPSTVDAAESAVHRCSKHNKKLLSGAIFAADAFFAFTDAPKMLVNAGCIGGLAPSGGVREKDVVAYFESQNIKVAFLNEDVRGFCRH